MRNREPSDHFAVPRAVGFCGHPSAVVCPKDDWQYKSDWRKEESMTKTTKALIAGAAFAGLLAGTATTVQASSTSLKTSMSSFAQDQKSDPKVKEKHACKGQNSCKGNGGCKSGDNGCKGKNSCKGKGGCATDGSKMPKS
jgi:hypothetical protein